MVEKPYVVVMGDIVDSREIREREKFQNGFVSLLEEVNSKYSSSLAAELTLIRGDEFQGLFKKGGDALRAIFDIYFSIDPVRMRFAVGCGNVETAFYSDVQKMDGPVFHRAREALEKAKEKQRKIFACGLDEDGEIETAWNIMGWMVFSRLDAQTFRQKEAVFLALQGKKQKEIAEITKVGKSAISQRLKSSGWEQIKTAAGWMEKQLEQV